MTPDEVMRLKAPRKDRLGNIQNAGEMLIFAAGHAPIKGTQILYFRDPWFKEAAKIGPPKQSDKILDAKQIRLKHAGGLASSSESSTCPATKHRVQPVVLERIQQPPIQAR